MKKLWYALLAVVVGVMIFLTYFYHPCKQPDEMLVGLTGLKCTIDILNKPVEEIRADACKYLGRQADCQFSEEDKMIIIEMINHQALDCVKKKLQEDNYCVDKVTSKGLIQ